VNDEVANTIVTKDDSYDEGGHLKIPYGVLDGGNIFLEASFHYSDELKAKIEHSGFHLEQRIGVLGLSWNVTYLEPALRDEAKKSDGWKGRDSLKEGPISVPSVPVFVTYDVLVQCWRRGRGLPGALDFSACQSTLPEAFSRKRPIELFGSNPCTMEKS